jgi:hypothetical protein
MYFFVLSGYALCEFCQATLCIITAFKLRSNFFVWRMVSKEYISFVIKRVLLNPGFEHFRPWPVFFLCAVSFYPCDGKLWITDARPYSRTEALPALQVYINQHLQEDLKRRRTDKVGRSERLDVARSLAWTWLSSNINSVFLCLGVSVHRSAALQVSL